MDEVNESGSLLVECIEQQPEVLQDGLLDAFSASPENFFYGDKVYIDRLGADAGIAAAKVPSAKSDYIDPKGIFSFEVEAPKYAMAIPFNFDAGKNVRLVGISPTDPINKEAVLLQILKSRTLVLLNRVKRAMIRQAAQIYETGKIAFSKEDGGLLDVDYKFSPELFADYSVKWINSDGTVNQSADPLKDIKQRMDLIYEKSGVSLFDLIFTDPALCGFLGNEKVKEFADKNKINLAQIAPQEQQANGKAYIGSYFIGGRKVDIYTFSGGYTGSDGKNCKYLTDGQVLVLPRNEGKYSIYFAGIEATGELDERLKSVSPTNNITIFGDKKAVDLWISTKEEDGGVFLKLTSRPVLAAVSQNTHGSFNIKAK